jgi:hypothetical protein
MAKTVLISEDRVITMLKELPETILMDMFAKMLVRSDTSPLTDEEEASYKKALKEHDNGEVINWEDLK